MYSILLDVTDENSSPHYVCHSFFDVVMTDNVQFGATLCCGSLFQVDNISRLVLAFFDRYDLTMIFDELGEGLSRIELMNNFCVVCANVVINENFYEAM